MRRLPHLAIVAVAAVLVLMTPATAPRHPRADRFDQPEAAARFEYARRAPRTPGVNTIALYEAADARITRMTRFSSRIGRELPAALPGTRVWLNSTQRVLDSWEPLGPGNIGGRTRVVRFHPSHPHTVLAAGVSGGIWRLDDASVGWRPIAESMVNIAVNALVIDPRDPDVMYAGTGEGFLREEIRGTGLPLRGAGIFATRDGGNTWTRLPATASADFYFVNDLELGIGDSRRVYAATRSGVWRSLDGGETWSPLLQTAVRAGCLDLAIRPDLQDDTLFASCGSYEQATVYRISSAASSASVNVVLREPGMGRTSLAIAPSRPNVMYAMSASNDPGPNADYEQGLLAVYRSTRGGDAGSWETRVSNTDAVKLNTLLLTNISSASVTDCSTNPNARNSVVNMGWYVNVLAVDPRDPDRVWAAGVDWLRSDDGGRNWGIATGNQGSASAHVDQHGIAFHPQYDGEQNQVMLIGNDGGVYRTSNARASVATGPRAACGQIASAIKWENLNRGYGVTQFYHGLPFANGTRYLAGAQDNGTDLGSDSQGPERWQTVFGGDGAYVAVTGDGSTMYVQSQFSNIARSTNGGASFQSVRNGLDEMRNSVLGPETNFLFVTPLLMDPSDQQRLWIGGDYLYRTTNAALLWTKASTQMPDGGLVSAISVAAQDGNRVIAGTTLGHLLRSTSALQTTASTEWLSTRPRDGWVTSIAHDPGNADVSYATYGNFGGPHVFRSRDGGATWSAIDGSGDGMLPDIPVHSIVVDPDDATRLYLGTDVGVFVSVDGGTSWMVEETGYGAAVTEWLALARGDNGHKLLFAFTHGLGAWRVDVP